VAYLSYTVQTLPAANSREDTATCVAVCGLTRQQSDRTTKIHSKNAQQTIVTLEATLSIWTL